MIKSLKGIVNRASNNKTIIKINNKTIGTAVNEWFKNSKNAENIYGHISRWDTSEVTDMRRLFYRKTSFNQPIGDWDVSKVINMEEMFCNASSFNQDISSWDVSNVTNMKAMFSFANSFNQPIEKWDVSALRNALFMFYEAKIFNKNLSNWDVCNVTSCTRFNLNTPQWLLPIPNFINCTL
jgi:surface protein